MEPVPRAKRFGNPWGLELFGIGYQYAGIKVNKYLYNGKELLEENGLQYYDYGARMYDPAIGGSVVDPLADHPNQVDKSPYAAMWNNPIRFNDPDGRCVSCPPGVKDEMRKSIPGYAYLPSGEVSQMIDKGIHLLSSSFDYSIGATATVYGAEVKGQVGPIKGKVGASVFEANLKTPNGNFVEAEGKLLNASLEVGFASANLEGSVSGAKGSLSVTKAGDIQASGQLLSLKGEATLGQNGFDLTLDNSTRIGIGGKVGLVKAEAGVNFGKLTQGTGILIQAGVQYLFETTNKMLN